MTSVENVLTGDRKQLGDAAALAEVAASGKVRPNPTQSDVPRGAPEPRTAPEPRVADIDTADKQAIEVPVAELRALAQKSRSANRKRWVARTALIAVVLLICVAGGVGATIDWDKIGLAWPDWTRSMTTAGVPHEAPAAEPARSSTAGASNPEVNLVQTALAPARGSSNAELEQRIKALADSLALVQGNLDKLVATQEQSMREITSLKDAEQELRKNAMAPRPAPLRKRTARAAPPALLPEQPAPEPVASTVTAPVPPPPSMPPTALMGPPASAAPPPPSQDTRGEPIPRPPMPLREH